MDQLNKKINLMDFRYNIYQNKFNKNMNTKFF